MKNVTEYNMKLVFDRPIIRKHLEMIEKEIYKREITDMNIDNENESIDSGMNINKYQIIIKLKNIIE